MKNRKTREAIVSAADTLFYERGFEATSFADIAAAVEISRGNFYYHFKTKDEILSAVIAKRIEDRRAMLAKWGEALAPRDRILRFIEILITNQSKIMTFGCPVGTLATELSKLAHPAQPDANQIFSVFRDWLRLQFEELGCGGRSDDLAMHLLMRSQGIATLAAAYKDEAFIRREAADMTGWLQSQLDPSKASPRPSH
ncbi:TetR family transcriptional regulator [Roseibium litorale]|uniref:TetR/AcrR family transcriptional regulator n=1 Tax=Roseibium litorale TaxID=2803841 RepID=A0ABR9CQS5_9HYPH|nr:TetR/AcrR family transcriptional regulator [Roseibium litorale]